MKEAFSLRTVRKKIVMLSKLAGIALIFSYLLSTSLPVNEEISFLIWLVFVLLLVCVLDFFMGRWISKPISMLNTSAKHMAKLDFSVPCSISSKDEFGELSLSLNTMAENLKQALTSLENSLQERKELMDNLSHEMKTPLGIIRAYAEGLQDETDEEKRQKYTQVIISEVDRMNDLIVTLLDLSALESGGASFHISQFEFVELVETVAGRLLVDVPDSNYRLEYQLPEQMFYIQADQRRMDQVLNNLIVNAKKNVVPQGVLRLEVTIDDEYLHFSIFNQGRSIPESDLSNIWTKFYRDHKASYSGSGLGLSIVAQILSMQNFPYGVENLEEGVRFYFSIPITESFHTDFTAVSHPSHTANIDSP